MESKIYQALLSPKEFFGIPILWLTTSMLVGFIPFLLLTILNTNFVTVLIGSFVPSTSLLFIGYILAQKDPNFTNIGRARLQHLADLYPKKQQTFSLESTWFEEPAGTTFKDRVIRKFFNPFSHLKISPLELPFLSIMNKDGLSTEGNLLISPDGLVTAFIKLEGLQYSSLSKGEIEQLFDLREGLFRRLSKDHTLSIYLIRFKEPKKILNNHQGLFKKIYQKHSEKLKIDFKNNYYIGLTTKKTIIKSKKTEAILEALLEQVNYAVANFKQAYKAYQIKDKELLSLVKTLANGQPQQAETTKPTALNLLNWAGLDRKLALEEYQYNLFEETFTYLQSGRQALFLSFKNLPEYSTGIFDALAQTNNECIAYIHFDNLSKTKAILNLNDKIRFFRNMKRNNTLTVELEELYDLIIAERLKLGKCYMQVQVIAEDAEQLKAAKNNVRQAIEARGFEINTDKTLKELLWLSQFPSRRKLNVRNFLITSENLADFVSFEDQPLGLTKNSFGNEPLCQFSTPSQSKYNLNFHISEESNVLGHTLVIGNTGSGKTTLTSFLLASALKYKNMRVIAFDQLNGLEIATRLMGGNYINFSDGMSINPFQLPEKEDTLDFFYEVLCNLPFEISHKDRTSIRQKLSDIFTWETESCYFKFIYDHICITGEPIHKEFEQWNKSGFFSQGQDSFNLNSPWTTFDLTELLNEDSKQARKKLGILVSYITQKIYSHSVGQPIIIFIDEFRRYLESPIFSKLFQRMIQELRKLNGVFICAVQSIRHIYNHPQGKENLQNFGKYIIYPSKEKTSEEAYREGLGLTDNEIDWLQNTNPSNRQVLVKTNGAESVVLDVDLSHLGTYLKAFNSDRQNVELMHKLIQENPNDYATQYFEKAR